MKPEDFTDEKAGRLIKGPQGYWAFVPDSLPPHLSVDWDLASLLSQADRALSELGGLARNLPNPHLLIGLFVRREAVLSSGIEGTQASLSDLFYFEAAHFEKTPLPQKPPSDVREVANYVKALEYALKRIKDLPLSLRLIKELHEILLSGVRGEHWTPGEFRRSQNWIGPHGCTLMDATFVPPPPQEMMEALGQFENFLHSPSNLPPLVRIALAHYQFEAIHPFLDGNGRIGRLLISLLLCHEGLIDQPLLYLSAFFEHRRLNYYQRLLDVSIGGKWRQWIEFFLEGVVEQSHDAIWRTNQLLGLWQVYRTRLQEARSSALLLQIVDRLFEYPVLSVPTTARFLNVTHRSAAKLVEKLVGMGIIAEMTGRERYRIYAAKEVIETIESSEIRNTENSAPGEKPLCCHSEESGRILPDDVRIPSFK
ncbi:MAG: Fic family protein [Candidatus Atribacteria bacterium]|nr:Fic family protein [Candidatus Atribacteria bacterium]